jgi:hypothetical protein
MIGRNLLIYRHLEEPGAAALLLASHQWLDSCPIFADAAWFFSDLLAEPGIERLSARA